VWTPAEQKIANRHKRGGEKGHPGGFARMGGGGGWVNHSKEDYKRAGTHGAARGGPFSRKTGGKNQRQQEIKLGLRDEKNRKRP